MSELAPRLLVSVRDAAEAVEALAGGADWIDLKEPRHGPLGAVDGATARSVVTLVAGRAPISAAAGELCDWPDAKAELLEVEGVSLLKLGLAGCAGSSAWHAAWRRANHQAGAVGKQMAAVIYVDCVAANAPRPPEVLDVAARTGCPWVLWDTFDKSGQSLAAHLRLEELKAELTAARRRGMKVAVAGRLDAEGIRLLPEGLIDLVAVRGAACRESRASEVCRRRVAELRNALHAKDPMMQCRG